MKERKKHFAQSSLISRSLYYEYKAKTNGLENYTQGLNCQSRLEVLEKDMRRRQLTEQWGILEEGHEQNLEG